ncbi:hypothetical protein K504DRAFT_499378 [Pleomassaria siparia CBS 279.74]|uniref:Uncharacterized protein n=1 Tax=Pleomassaria siparia CBS 279.74 TaxID=1314801 RepID=A0A6G1KHG7_9PLEO|nr:hypothetical protein K504DRAFT_499378 [Pleomassaria siparia CBS 279.74]
MVRALAFEGPTPSRYCASYLVSLLSVAAYHIPSTWPLFQACSWLFLPAITSVLVRTLCLAYSDDYPSHFYSIPLGHILLVLGHVSAAIQAHTVVADPTGHSPQARLCAIHFALSFLVLTEVEFYRRYFNFRPFPRTFMGFLESLLLANFDHDFKEHRHDVAYLHCTSDSWESPWDSLLVVILLFLFYVPMACLNYPVKRLANPAPSSQGEDFYFLLGAGDVLFIVENMRLKVLTTFLLQRPVRALNKILFWWCVDFGRYVSRMWKQQGAGPVSDKKDVMDAHAEL